MLKKTIILFLAGVLGLSFVPAAFAQAKFKVAIVRMNDRATYLEGQEGVISGFKKAGFDDTRVEFDIRNAQNSLDKLAEIAKDLKAKKVDLIIPLGTDAAIYMAKEIKDIPIVFSQVHDPVASGIAKSFESSGNNTTGTKSGIESVILINLLRKIVPVKHLGLLYSDDDSQSLVIKEELEKLQSGLGFTLISVDVKNPEDTDDITKSLVGRIDSMVIGSGNTITKGLDAIVEVITKSKIPNIGYSLNRAEKGVLFAVTSDRVKLGKLAAEKAIQILNGKNPSDVPIEGLEDFDIIVNLKSAEAMGIKVRMPLLKMATKVIGAE